METYTLILFYLVVGEGGYERPTAITLCNGTATVFYDGFPIYTIIGRGCVTVPLLARNFTVSGDEVFFWNLPVTLHSYEREGKASLTVPLWAIIILILVLRELTSTPASL